MLLKLSNWLKLKISLVNWKPLEIFSAGLLLLFYPFLLGKTIFFGDNFSLMVPGKIVTAYWIRHGQLLTWNPYILGGISWIGDINQSILYPSTLIFAVFHPAVALNLTTIFHFIISFIGIWWLSGLWIKNSASKSRSKNAQILAARTITSLLWVFSSQYLASINNLTTLQSITWMPWVVGFGWQQSKGWKWKLGFVVSIWLQLAGGYPQHVLYSGLLAVVFSWIDNRKSFGDWWGSWSVLSIFTLLSTSMIWVPFIQVLANSTRALQTVKQSLSGSLHPTELIKIIIPYFFDNAREGIRWGPNWNGTPNQFIYLTWFGLFTVFLKWWQEKFSNRDWWLLGISLGSIVLALGEFLPGMELFLNLIPFLTIVRSPVIALIIPSLLLPLLIGESLTKISITKTDLKWIFFFSLLIMATSFITLAAIHFDLQTLWTLADNVLGGKLSSSAFHTLERDLLIIKLITTSLLVASFSFFISLQAWRYKKWWLLATVILIDMLYHTSGSLFFAPNSIYPSWPEVEAAKLPISVSKDKFYLINNSNQPYTGFEAYWGALTVRKPFSDSFIDNQELKTFERLVEMRQGLTPNWNAVFRIKSLNGYTTLMPQEIDKAWNKTETTSVNSLPQISLTDPKLKEWRVDEIIIDTWIPETLETQDLELIQEVENWKIYKTK